MALRRLTTLLRPTTTQVQSRTCAYFFPNRIGNREVVCHGINGEPIYCDTTEFPCPAIRYKEITPDIQVLKEKEKGDWKKLSIQDKKTLYRASFRQTFAEIEAPNGEWKCMIGCSFMVVTLALWVFIWLKHNVYPPPPKSLDLESRLAQYERIKLLDMQPISGIPGHKREG